MTYFNRASWGASAPRGTQTAWQPGFPNSLTVHAVGAPLVEQDNYLGTVKNIQTHAFGKGLSDIDYNYLVDLHGNVYEGRIPGKRSGAQGVGNIASLAVCYLDYGDGNIPFTDAAKTAILNLRNTYVVGGATAPIHPHRYWNPFNLAAGHGDYVTDCPGGEIADWCANPTASTPVAPTPLPPKPKRSATRGKNKMDSMYYVGAAHVFWISKNGHLQWFNGTKTVDLTRAKGLNESFSLEKGAVATLNEATLAMEVSTVSAADDGLLQWRKVGGGDWSVTRYNAA